MANAQPGQPVGRELAILVPGSGSPVRADVAWLTPSRMHARVDGAIAHLDVRGLQRVRRPNGARDEAPLVGPTRHEPPARDNGPGWHFETADPNRLGRAL